MTPDWKGPALAFGLSLVVTGLARGAALKAGALDLPSDRRTHARPTPRIGGIGILAGLVPALVAAGPFGWGPALFFLVGAADDVGGRGLGLPARAKFLLQIACATVAVAVLGLRFAGRGDGAFPDLDLGAAAGPATVLWVVAVVNVVNFLDGIDGIAAATSVVVLSAAAASVPEAAAGLPLAAVGAVLGFAVWNAPPARIFMGDGGSHLLGFLLAAAPCTRGPASSGSASATAAPWALVTAPLLPSVLDVLEALVHKVRAGIPLSAAHADHLYQRLVKAGRSHGAVALRYGLLSLVAVVLAGPVAARFGPVAAIAPGIAVLVLHWTTALRATRAVPRLERP